MLAKVFLPKTQNRTHFFPNLKGVNTLVFKPGINCIIGPNASGKTTIINAFKWRKEFKGNRGYESISIPTYVDCEYIYKVSLTEPPKHILWYEPQAYSRFNSDISNEVMQTRGVDAFLRLSIYRESEGECCAHYFSQWFSKNQQALVDGSVIVLVDEIENSNDPVTVGMIMDTFHNWCEHNKQLQILITTHSPIVLSRADHVVETRKGWREEMRKEYLKVLTQIE